MNRIFKTFFILVLASFVLVACSPAKEFKAELSQIDSCLVKIDSMEILFDGIEFDSLKLMVEHVELNEGLIKELYVPDTLNETFGKQMNDSKAIRKSLKSVGKDQTLYGDEFNAIKHQFIDLKEDILNGIFNKEQIEEYLNVEMAALSAVSLSFSGFYKMQNKEKYRYYMVVPEVDIFIENLKAQREELE